ncbi:MAG: M20/M25/M40 family metallo-hydrolase [Candidatus Thermoplasmatota archaeon]
MNPIAKRLLVLGCVFILLFSLLISLPPSRLGSEKEEDRSAIVEISGPKDITMLNRLGVEIVERTTDRAFIEATDSDITLMEMMEMDVEILSEEEDLEDRITASINAPQFPGYDPTIHSMMNETKETNIYDNIDILQNFENADGVRTRRSGTQGYWDAVDWTYNKFDSYGLEVFQQNFTYTGGESANVIAELPGSDPDLKDETFIIGAHLDSINSRGADEPAPGADDNGSGIALTLEAARVLSKYEFNRTIKFAAWGAEEQGLHGSSHYASNVDPEEDLRGNLNYDMIGYAEDDVLDVTLHANTQSNWMLDYKADVAGAYEPGVNFTYEYDSDETRSDHSSFWDEGYNATLAIETVFSPHYHSENDTLDKLTIPQIDYTTQHAIGTVAHLAGLRNQTGEPLHPDEPRPQDGATDVTLAPQLSVHAEHDIGENMSVSFYDASNDILIGTDDNVPSGGRAYTTWNHLNYSTTYEWYAVAEDDGGGMAQSQTWSFTTMDEIELLPPSGLSVKKDEGMGHLRLEWGDVGAPQYRVYHSEDQYADFESWDKVATVEETNYTHEDALGGENYYMVRSTSGVEESENSTMAFCIERYFEAERPRHYISIPMGFEGHAGDGELRASDLVESIEGDLGSSEYIFDVIRWDPQIMGYSERFYYDDLAGEWTDDFVIEPGDGIAFGVKNSFTWHINGTDTQHEIFYEEEDSRHYTSIPYTLADQTGNGELMASDLVKAIEGDLESGENITEIIRWNPMNRGTGERFHYDESSGEWKDDFVIEPGDGIGFMVNKAFRWEVELITP